MKNKGPRPETLKYERTHSNQMDVTHRYLSCAATVQAQRMFLFRRKNMVLGLLHQTSQLLRIFHYRETPPCSGARAPGSAKYKGLHSWLLPGSAQASYSSDEMKEGGIHCYWAPQLLYVQPSVVFHSSELPLLGAYTTKISKPRLGLITHHTICRCISTTVLESSL